jgi:hypothetical protein
MLIVRPASEVGFSKANWNPAGTPPEKSCLQQGRPRPLASGAAIPQQKHDTLINPNRSVDDGRALDSMRHCLTPQISFLCDTRMTVDYGGYVQSSVSVVGERRRTKPQERLLGVLLTSIMPHWA